MLSIPTRLLLAAALLAGAGLSACGPTTPANQPSSTPSANSSTSPATTVAFAEIKTIIDNRCVSCHAQTPTNSAYRSPAGGLDLETAAQIQSSASRINARVQSRSMPQGNVTNMTDAERAQVKLWVEQGANL